ncbi:MAG: hypothetical protein OXN21_11240 [Chloroflexota bacterium]|nr:hypothetical protein [Chloroflexota bacterium]
MAVTLTVAELAYDLRLVADTTATIEEPLLGVLTRTLAAATALVTAYAADAPDAIANSAALRVGTYLYDTPAGFSNRSQHPLRDSGAMALLAPYRSRRAVAITSED